MVPPDLIWILSGKFCPSERLVYWKHFVTPRLFFITKITCSNKSGRSDYQINEQFGSKSKWLSSNPNTNGRFNGYVVRLFPLQPNMRPLSRHSRCQNSNGGRALQCLGFGYILLQLMWTHGNMLILSDLLDCDWTNSYRIAYIQISTVKCTRKAAYELQSSLNTFARRWNSHLRWLRFKVCFREDVITKRIEYVWLVPACAGVRC